jgi:alpha-tubulin suppressor-like RCC1 family protein
MRKISAAFFVLALLAVPAHAADPRDMMSLSSVIVTGNSPQDIASWPVTGTISQLTMTPGQYNGLSFVFPQHETWPDYTPPGWDGPIEYTVWAVAKVNGQWYMSGFIQMWRTRESTGAPILTDFHANWAYSYDRWGQLYNYYPQVGDQMGFFISAGDARGNPNVTSVRERTNVVVVNLPAGDSGVFNFTSTPSAPSLMPTGELSAGAYHTCALSSVSGVRCWGQNVYGQLGDGTTTDRAVPRDVVGLATGVTAVAAGGGHSCALTNGGGVKCWGSNAYGQLGDGTTTTRTTPVAVAGLSSGVTAVSAGGTHTCALLSAGTVKCWGRNLEGQLGDGSTTNRPTPVSITGSITGTQVSAGGGHSCVVTSGGGLKCWGDNTYSQLGDGTNTRRLAPTDVSGLTSGATMVSAGGSETCAVTNAGGAKCWGNGLSAAPSDVSGLTSEIRGVAAGGFHACAVNTPHGAKCWGANSNGQIGDGTTTTRSTPVDVSGLTGGVRMISAGLYHTCAAAPPVVRCWGDNTFGQLGDGTTTLRLTSVTLTGPAFTDNPLTAGVTVIKAVHVTELRSRIDAVRTRYNLALYSWSRPLPTLGGSIVSVVDITSLRTALADAYSAAGRNPPTYVVDPTLGAGVTVKAAHFAEIRAALLGIE